MAKAENKLARPIEMSEVDRLRLQLYTERTHRAQAVLHAIQEQENALKTELAERYKMGPTDIVNFATGAITRHPESQGA